MYKLFSTVAAFLGVDPRAVINKDARKDMQDNSPDSGITKEARRWGSHLQFQPSGG